VLYPLFYFHPEWGKDRYSLPHGVSLLRPGPEDIRQVTASLTPQCRVADELAFVAECVEYINFDEYWPNGCALWQASPCKWEDAKLEWLLCIELPSFEQEPAAGDVGIDVKAELADDLLDCFLNCLRLLGDRSSFAPVRLKAPLDPQGPLLGDARLASPAWRMALSDPDRIAASSLNESHWPHLRTIWARVTSLQGLTDWRRHMRMPETFRDMHWEAGELASEGDLSSWMQFFEDEWGVVLSVEEAKKLVSLLEALRGSPVRKPLNAYGEVGAERRALLRRKVLDQRAMMKQDAVSRTRIGRAVDMLFVSFDLPPRRTDCWRPVPSWRRFFGRMTFPKTT
jgi:hypothetical protein